MTLPPLLSYLASVAPLGPLVHDMDSVSGKILLPRPQSSPFRRLAVIQLKGPGHLSTHHDCCSLTVPQQGWPAILEQPARMREILAACSRSKNGWGFHWSRLAFLPRGMYLKGYVRSVAFQMSLAIIPSLLLIAVLFQHRLSFSRPKPAS